MLMHWKATAVAIQILRQMHSVNAMMKKEAERCILKNRADQ